MARNVKDLSFITGRARSPVDQGRLLPVMVPNDLIQKLASTRSTTKLFELHYVICGELPKVNNVGYHERLSEIQDEWKGLECAVAIFKGVKRPLNHKGEDKKIHAYVLRPKFTYSFVPDMVCIAKRSASPKNSVFVVYVTFDRECEQATLLNWEWVKAANGVPENADQRYDEEVWRHG